MYNVLLSDNNNNKNIDKSNNDNKKCVCFATKNMHSKRSPQLRFYQLRARELKTFFCYWLVSQNVWHKINQPMTKMIKVQPEMSESDMEKRSLCVYERMTRPREWIPLMLCKYRGRQSKNNKNMPRQCHFVNASATRSPSDWISNDAFNAKKMVI